MFEREVVRDSLLINEIMSSFTHPKVDPNLFEFLFSVEHKEDILKNMGNQTVDDFLSIRQKNTMWEPTVVEIHSGLDQLEDE